MPQDQRLLEGLADFRRVIRQFLAFSETATHAAGVTPRQYQALLVIKTHPAGMIGVGELAEQMLLQHHGAVQLVDRLVKAELAERLRSEVDQRRVMVAITLKGTDLLAQLAHHHATELLKHEPLLAELLRRLRLIAKM